MRIFCFAPCALAVNALRRGAAPRAAAEAAVHRIARRVEGYIGALVVVDAAGRVGAAAAGFAAFQYSVRGAGDAAARVVDVPPLKLQDRFGCMIGSITCVIPRESG
jgi:hypothetical protein